HIARGGVRCRIFGNRSRIVHRRQLGRAVDRNGQRSAGRGDAVAGGVIDRVRQRLAIVQCVNSRVGVVEGVRERAVGIDMERAVRARNVGVDAGGGAVDGADRLGARATGVVG